ncbi:hypothetical protein COO91_03059 [Nostoc flagelliforme CCNUN1]|uniref:Uncharacterized protein n=1 Tax=Nostoc flagelliforme CCNUN1 TaxID=2038116 RepID=A0A2K8SP86_9NOSO|nr:hypothetical protein COO91_03059 [Nostoc flagelliforme CCNUN1]
MRFSTYREKSEDATVMQSATRSHFVKNVGRIYLLGIPR